MLAPNGNVAHEPNVDYPRAPKMFFDINYPFTGAGQLKLLQAAIGLFGYMCMRVVTKQYYFPAGRYYEFVAAVGVLTSLSFGAMYMIHFTDVSEHKIPWVLMEIIFALVFSILYCIVGGVVASWAEYHTLLGIAALLAFIATTLYGYEALAKCKILMRDGSSTDRQRSRGSSCVTIS